ncbi:MAG: GFA family protein [Pseudomonadota bacterium]
MSHEVKNGGCLCGAVRYQVSGPVRDIVNCHCEMCVRIHGAAGAHSKARKSDITITHDKGLAWYETSQIARRGFCKICGSGLFWEPLAQDGTGILAGTLDDCDELRTIGHIFVAEKPGFYNITDDLPQFEGSSEGKLPGDYL